MRNTYIKSTLNNPLLKEIWQTEKTNSMFTRAFIADMDKIEAAEPPAFLGAGRGAVG